VSEIAVILSEAKDPTWQHLDGGAVILL